MDPLYGRDEILSRASAWARAAFAGDGRLVLFAGEPGIGKSTIAGRIAAEASRENASVVAWGRCWEVGGAPAYWPWIQIFRELGMDEDPFAGVVPDLSSSASEARFAAFDQAVRALKAKAVEAPLVLVLDDLHVADAPSLLVLLLLARQLRGSRILVVGAYRDAEARLQPGAIGGPDDLDGPALAAALSEGIGRRIGYAAIPPDVAERGLAAQFGPAVAQGIARTYHYCAEYADAPLLTGASASLTNALSRPRITVADWARARTWNAR